MDWLDNTLVFVKKLLQNAVGAPSPTQRQNTSAEAHVMPQVAQRFSALAYLPDQHEIPSISFIYISFIYIFYI